jgi:hypothetical protein
MRVPQVSERIKEAPAQALRGVFAGIGQLLLITDKLRNKAPADIPHPRTPAAPQTPADATASGPADQQDEAAEPAPASSAPTGSAPAASTAAGSVAAASVPVESAVAASAPAESASAETAGPKSAPPKSAPPKSAPPKSAGARSAPPKSAPSGPTPAKAARAQAPKSPKLTRDFDKTGNVRLISDDGATTAAPDSTATASAAPTASAVATASARAPAESTAAGSTTGEPTAGDSAPLPNYAELSVASLRARLRSLDVTQVRRLADYERAHAARGDVISMFERRIAKLEAEAKAQAEAKAEAEAELEAEA